MRDVEVSPAGLVTIRKPFAHRRLQQSLFRILRENQLCSMSTITPEGLAHVNTAYFCYSPTLDVFFLSDPSSLHCRNVQRNSTMAMAIFRSDQPWNRPGRGIQMFGTCAQARGGKVGEATALYAKRFAAYRRHLQGTRETDRRIAKGLRAYRFYRFLPSSVKIMDESAFGGGVFVVADVQRGR